MYEVTPLPAERLLRLTLGGFLTVGEFEQFEAEVEQAIRRSNWSPGTYNCLVDLRDRDVLSQAVMKRIQFSHDKGFNQPRKTAILLQRSLVKLQVQRVMPEGSELFESEKEAMAWLSK